MSLQFGTATKHVGGTRSLPPLPLTSGFLEVTRPLLCRLDFLRGRCPSLCKCGRWRFDACAHRQWQRPPWQLLGCPLGFFCKNERCIFRFHHNFINLDIWSMSALSHVVERWCSQLMSQFDCYRLRLVYSTVEHRRPAKNLQHNTWQTTFDTFDQSQHLLHTLHKSFLSLSCIFTFLEIIKYNMLKMLHIFLRLQY